MFAVVDGEDFEIEVVEPDDEFFVAKLLFLSFFKLDWAQDLCFSQFLRYPEGPRAFEDFTRDPRKWLRVPK